MDAAGLGERLAARLARGRAAEEARQRDTCRITRPGDGEPVFNKATGQYDDPEPIKVYEGSCRIPRRDPTAGAPAEAGEAAWQVGESGLNLPFSDPTSADVRVGMTVTYLTSLDDPGLVGNVYGITGINDHSQANARRFRMKRVVGE